MCFSTAARWDGPAGTSGPRLIAGSIDLRDVVAIGGVHGGARPRQRTVAVARRPFRRAPHGTRARRYRSGPLHRRAGGNRAHRVLRVLVAGVPPLPARRGRAVRPGTRIAHRAPALTFG